jgi:transcriptional regulator with XRE-family HTH domain
MPDTRHDPTEVSTDGAAQLGDKLRHLRRKSGLTLKQLGDLTGCSESMLSKAERGHVVPSLDLLSRVAQQLGTSVAGLFAEAPEQSCFVYKEGERPKLELGTATPDGHTVLERLIPYARGRQLNANLHVVPPGGGSAGVLSHAGEEVGFVIEGYIEITVDTETHLVGPGGSFFSHSELPHSYRNIGTTAARIVWVNSPPY